MKVPYSGDLCHLSFALFYIDKKAKNNLSFLMKTLMIKCGFFAIFIIILIVTIARFVTSDTIDTPEPLISVASDTSEALADEPQIKLSCFLAVFDQNNNRYEIRLPEMQKEFMDIQNIERMRMSIFDYDFDISFINDIKRLKELSIWSINSNLIDKLELLNDLQNLEKLSIYNQTIHINNINFVENFKKLKELSVTGDSIRNIDALIYSQNLETLYLSSVVIEDEHISLLKNLSYLKELSLRIDGIKEGAENIEYIFDLPQLNSLALAVWYEKIGLVDLDIEKIISFLPDLTSLRLEYPLKINDITQIGTLQKLEHLTLQNANARGVTNLNWVSNLHNLKSINLGVFGIDNVHALSQLPNLTDVYLQGYRNNFDISSLAESNTLKRITIDFYEYPDDPFPYKIFEERGIEIDGRYPGKE